MRAIFGRGHVEEHIIDGGYMRPDGKASRKILQNGPDLPCHRRQENSGVHFGVHTRARLGWLDPNEGHRNLLKKLGSEQEGRWGNGFLNRGSGVRIPPGLPCLFF